MKRPSLIRCFTALLVATLATGAHAQRTNPMRQAGRHIVQPGETLSVIALAHQVAVKDLAAQNNIRNPNRIVAGQELILPAPDTFRPLSTVDRIRAEVENITGCTNGDVVVAALESIWGKNLGRAWVPFGGSGNDPFWELEKTMVGPGHSGLLVRVYSGSVVGNDYLLLYKQVQQSLVPLFRTQGVVLKVLPDSMSHGQYDIYWMSHMSAAGGPYEYRRWTGSEYEVYQSGDLDKEATHGPTKESSVTVTRGTAAAYAPVAPRITVRSL